MRIQEPERMAGERTHTAFKVGYYTMTRKEGLRYESTIAISIT